MSRKVLVIFFALFGSLCRGRQLKMAVIMPDASSNYPINNETSSAALALALRTIERNQQLLNGYTLGPVHSYQLITRVYSISNGRTENQDSPGGVLDLCFPITDNRISGNQLIPTMDILHYPNNDEGTAKIRIVKPTTTKVILVLRMRTFPTDCSSYSGLMAATAAQDTYNPDVIIGPPCADAMSTVAGTAAISNTPLFSWYTPSKEFDGFRNLIRLHPPMKTLGKALAHTLQERGQNQVSVIYAGTEPYTLLKDSVQKELPLSNIQVNYAQRYNPRISETQLDQMMIDMKHYGKNIVLMASSDDVRRIMLAAERTGMPAEQFTFIHTDPQIYSGAELNNAVMGEGYWKRGDLADPIARQAYNSLTRMIIDPMNDDQTPTIMSPRSRFKEFSALGAKVVQGTGTPATSDVHAQFLYDTASTWAVLANQLIAENNVSVKDGQAMAERAKRFRAEGSTGFISFDNNVDRTAKVFELGMSPNGAFMPSKILQYDPMTGLYKTKIVKQAKPTTSQTSHQPAMSDAPYADPALPQTHPTLVDPMNTQNTALAIAPAVVGPAEGIASFNDLISRISQLEAAVKKALNHNHRTDHAPHELPQPAVASHFHPPAVNTHTGFASAPLAATAPLAHTFTASGAHGQTPLAPRQFDMPNHALSMSSTFPFDKSASQHVTANDINPSLVSTTKQQETMVLADTSAKAKSSASNPMDSFTSQILKQITGVIDKRLSKLTANQGGASGEAPPSKTSEAAVKKEVPPKKTKARSGGGGEAATNGGEAAMNREAPAVSSEYTEMMQRFGEEVGLPASFFMNFRPPGPRFIRRSNIPNNLANQPSGTPPTTTPYYWVDYGAW